MSPRPVPSPRAERCLPSHTVEIEGGKIQQFEELPAATVDVPEAKLQPKIVEELSQ
jgi:hypothetical protein